MNDPRKAFLDRVRQAVRAGNRFGQGADIPPRGSIGYQGAGPDPALRFRDELAAAGGSAYLVPDREAAVTQVLELASAKAPRRILLGRGAFLDSLQLEGALRGLASLVDLVDSFNSDNCRETFFSADLGISGVDYLIAETGSIVFLAKSDDPRSLSLLPPVHIAVAECSQLKPDLFDLFDVELQAGRKDLPSCLTLITGPSKTGDIELKLVTGVHGPGEVHVVLVTDGPR